VTLVDLVHHPATTADDVVSLVAAVRELGVPIRDVRAVLAARRSIRGRALLEDLLAPSSVGIESPLEHRYVRDVELAHGLTRAQLQHRQRVDDVSIRADVRYVRFRVRVELDGEVGHPGGTTDADVWRDNAVLVHSGEVTLRFRWRHVAVAPCRVAAQVAAALAARGWRGTPRRCGPGCTLEVELNAQSDVPY
jgi:very-short-patch-repair endonuclease